MASKSNRVTPPTTRPAAPRSAPRAPGAAASSSEKDRTSAPPIPADDQIRARAYFLWEEAGCPECDGVQFWLEAEKEQAAPR